MSFIALFAMSFTTNAKDYYLFGDNIGWDANTVPKFTDNGNGIYTIADYTLLKGNFKIATSDWSEEYGGNSSNTKDVIEIDLNSEVTMASPGCNLSTKIDVQATKITFTKPESGNPTIKIEGTPITDAGKNFYIVGINNVWDANSKNTDWLFTYEGDGVYTIKNKSLPVGNFMIASEGWADQYGLGTSGSSNQIDPNMIYTLNGTGNLTTKEDLQCSQITLTVPASGSPTLKIEGSAITLSGMFIVGDCTNWAQNQEYNFIDNGNNNYTLSNVVIGAGVQIANTSWSPYYGGNGEILPNTSYNLTQSGNNPIIFDDAYNCSKVVFNFDPLNPTAATLYFEGTPLPLSNKIYVWGDNNSNASGEDNNVLTETSTSGIFEGSINFPTVIDKNTNKAKEYDNFVLFNTQYCGGRWGLAEESAESSKNGKLVKSFEAKSLNVTVGSHKIIFNRNTGSYAIDGPLSGVNTINNNDIIIYSNNGTIYTTGTEMSIYSLSGVTIANNVTEFSVAPGLYIVKSDNIIKKIIVK